MHAESTLIRSMFLARLALKIGRVIIIRGINRIGEWREGRIMYRVIGIVRVTVIIMRTRDSKT